MIARRPHRIEKDMMAGQMQGKVSDFVAWRPLFTRCVDIRDSHPQAPGGDRAGPT